MNCKTVNDGVVVETLVTEPNSQQLDQIVDPLSLKAATQMAAVLLANDQLLGQLLGE